MTVLQEIFEHKAVEVEAAKRRLPMPEIRAISRDADPVRGFRRALESTKGLALIAEIKKASPSRGVIRADFEAGEIAAIYEEAGAHALSVLTDEPYFGGSAENLRVARRRTHLPCLRKDFINDPYQVYEARAWGADAVLLIVAALEPGQVSDLRSLIEDLGMDALVEVHSEAELEVALALECPLIGVNNRNLGDLSTSISTSDQLLPAVARSGALAVSESALDSRTALDRVEQAGARAVLIGTSFCAAPDIGAKVREVMGW